MNDETKDFMQGSAALREVGFKLLGLSYLIEQCGKESTPPTDSAGAFVGISLILQQIQEEVLCVAQDIERRNLRYRLGRSHKSDNQDNASEVEDL